MIEVRDVSKQFRLTRKQRREMGEAGRSGVVQSVAGVSFTCQPGRIFTLLGPNGAGKTTTLRMIATMLAPDSGRISVAGHDVVREGQKVRESMGFLTGSTGLYARLTVDELIAYYAQLQGMDDRLFRSRRDELYDLLDVRSFSGQRIGKLSAGMKQKVSIIRTIIHDPAVVVFDEPTVGLDVLTSRRIVALIRRCREEGKTVIFSTHIMGEVSQLADDLAIIHKGKLVWEGTFARFEEQKEARTIEDEFIRLVGGEGGLS